MRQRLNIREQLRRGNARLILILIAAIVNADMTSFAEP